MQVTVLYFDGCPNWRTAAERLSLLADELGFSLVCREVHTPEQAEEVGFCGSPSILVDGCDVFAEGDEQVGLSCRMYHTPQGLAGSPSVGQLRTVLSSHATGRG